MNILSWLRVNRFTGNERGIRKHEWFGISYEEMEFDAGNTEDKSTSGASLELASRIQTWVIRCRSFWGVVLLQLAASLRSSDQHGTHALQSLTLSINTSHLNYSPSFSSVASSLAVLCTSFVSIPASFPKSHMYLSSGATSKSNQTISFL